MATGVLMGALFVVVAFNTSRWIGETFPGFFVMANRVVPRFALPDWFESNPAGVFHHEVVAIDGQAVTTATDVYGLVKMRPAGTPIRYTLRGQDGVVTTEVMSSRRFSGVDYLLTFSPFLLCGMAFLVTGLVVFQLKPGRPASFGLLSASSAIGVTVVTAADLCGPQWFVGLHAIAQCFAAAGLIHLALVFPTDRIRGCRQAALSAVYLPFVVLAVLCQVVPLWPSAYHSVHLMVRVGEGVAGLATVAAVTYDLLTTRSALVRRRIGVVVLGTLSGLFVPTVVMLASEPLDGRLGLYWAGLTACVFPLSLGYAIVKRDLFEIDDLLRRAMTYTVVVIAVTTGYSVALCFIGLLVPGREVVAHSLATLAMLNLGLCLLIAPTRKRVQQWVDRLFFPDGYDPEHALSKVGQLLACARAINDVIAGVSQVLTEALGPHSSVTLLRQCEGRFHVAGPADETLAGDHGNKIELPSGLAARLERGELLARYEWEDGSGRPMPIIWRQLNAELLIPVRSGDALAAILVLGAKGSGRAYTSRDVTFLRALASQMVLAMNNAAAFSLLQEMNARLEQQVHERTAAVDAATAELNRSNAELNHSNVELNRSLVELRHAYQQLEQSQASLLRADRLATLGRLTAGIAHEMNTPLSAALNSLKVLADLGQEYVAAIDDSQVLPADHREIAGEIVSTVQAATEWTQKAIAFIRSVKAHQREGGVTTTERFPVSTVVAETQALLVHRLRVAACRIDFEEEPEQVSVVGNPARLAQVLVNLVANAVDAYEEAGISGGRIEVHVQHADGTVKLDVRDWAGGIPPHVLPHIFDELFTTKAAGRGTGLGLWIARNIIGESFRGKLDVFTTRGVGSCFTATFPADASEAEVTLIASRESVPVPLRESVAIKHEAGSAELRPVDEERFLVSAVAEEIQTQLAHRLRAASCAIDFEEEAEGITLVGDPAQFRQVLAALVTNAITAYEAGSSADGRIEVRVRRSEETVTVAVRDWAGGIPLQLLPRIFERAFTMDESTGEPALGLWIARNIVEQRFGGILDVLTATGGGSCFIAILPVEPDDAASAPTGPKLLDHSSHLPGLGQAAGSL